VRPHQLDIAFEHEGGSQFPATVRHVNTAGPMVKVDLVAKWGDPVRVELSQDRFRALGLKAGDEVFVSPRDASMFPDE